MCDCFIWRVFSLFFFVSHRLGFRSSTTLCPNIFSVQIAIQKSFLSWDTLKTHLILSLRLLKANHIKEFSFLGQSDELFLLSTLSQTQNQARPSVPLSQMQTQARPWVPTFSISYPASISNHSL